MGGGFFFWSFDSFESISSFGLLAVVVGCWLLVVVERNDWGEVRWRVRISFYISYVSYPPIQSFVFSFFFPV